MSFKYPIFCRSALVSVFSSDTSSLVFSLDPTPTIHAFVSLFLRPPVGYVAEGADQQRDQQDGSKVHQLPGVHRQPEHCGGEEVGRGDHLLKVWPGAGLLCAQGLRLHPVRQREARPGGRDGGEREGAGRTDAG